MATTVAFFVATKYTSIPLIPESRQPINFKYSALFDFRMLLKLVIRDSDVVEIR